MSTKRLKPGESVAAVPESQRWTLEEPHRSTIEHAIAWAAKSKPRESGLDAMLKKWAFPGPGRSR